jgi:hypothetical protein
MHRDGALPEARLHQSVSNAAAQPLPKRWHGKCVTGLDGPSWTGKAHPFPEHR